MNYQTENIKQGLLDAARGSRCVKAMKALFNEPGGFQQCFDLLEERSLARTAAKTKSQAKCRQDPVKKSKHNAFNVKYRQDWKKKLMDHCGHQTFVSGSTTERIDYHHVIPFSKLKDPNQAFDDWEEIDKCVPMTVGEHRLYHCSLAKKFGPREYPIPFNYKKHFLDWVKDYRIENNVSNDSKYGQAEYWEVLK